MRLSGIQMSPVHTGRRSDTDTLVDHLLECMVRPMKTVTTTS